MKAIYSPIQWRFRTKKFPGLFATTELLPSHYPLISFIVVVSESVLVRASITSPIIDFTFSLILVLNFCLSFCQIISLPFFYHCLYLTTYFCPVIFAGFFSEPSSLSVPLIQPVSLSVSLCSVPVRCTHIQKCL